MPNLDRNIAQFEEVLGRFLEPEERRLLMQWEAFVANQQGAVPMGASTGMPMTDDFVEPDAPAEHAGRFKISWVKGEFEVGFVCPSLMLRPVRLPTAEDVVEFLVQDPINLDDQRIRQAMAAAQNQRPTQVAQDVQISEPVLRSMGFEHL